MAHSAETNHNRGGLSRWASSGIRDSFHTAASYTSLTRATVIAVLRLCGKSGSVKVATGACPADLYNLRTFAVIVIEFSPAPCDY
eukprot:2068427-Pleurochrysis_carterae.AAC.1